MTDDVTEHDPDDTTDESSDGVTEQERKRLRAKVFGDVLPDTTTDEVREKDEAETQDDWLRRQVPPHHG